MQKFISRFLPLITWLTMINTLAVFPARARWAAFDDSPAESEYDNYDISINDDGTSRTVRKSLLVIKNEEGRSTYGTTTFKYTPTTTSISELHAYTQNGTQTFVVPAELIEDKPFASSAEGFDETHQISIAYPHVGIGSKLFLSFVRDEKAVPIPNLFTDEYSFGQDYTERASEVRFSSSRPLFIEINDPLKVLESLPTKVGDRFFYTIKLLKPIYAKVVDEEDESLNRRDETWAVVSTAREWESLARPVAKFYEDVINSELPISYRNIFLRAAAKKDPIDQINTVTSLLQDEVRYMGDWRTLQGGHVPRTLSTIASTRFGDCKDYSVSTAAILRHLGIDAKVAWIERSVKPTPLPSFALDAAFNHAIVRVVIGNKVLWVDPTNYSSFAQGIYDDILGRFALVIDTKHPALEKTPDAKSSDSERITETHLSFDRVGNAELRATLTFNGRSATSFAGISRQMSQASLEHLLTKSLANDEVIESSEVEVPDLSSRITRNLVFRAKMQLRDLALKTTAGRAYELGRGTLGPLIDLDPESRVSDLVLDPPEITKKVLYLDEVKLVGKKPTGCKITSPWLNASREVQTGSSGIVVMDTTESKQLVINNSELKTVQFRKLQSDLRRCFQHVALVFR